MKRFFILLSIFFCSVAVAETITINWGVDNKPYTITTCEIGGDVILPTSPTKRGHVFKGWKKLYNRGSFEYFGEVPGAAELYNEDANGNRVPLKDDYIIVKDASHYGEYTNVFTKDFSDTFNTYWSYTDFLTITPNADVYVRYNRKYGATARGNISFYNANKQLTRSQEFQTTAGVGEYQDYVFAQNNELYCKIQYMTNYDKDISVIVPKNIGTHKGAWRFVYDGVWEKDGKIGWKPAEQIISE